LKVPRGRSPLCNLGASHQHGRFGHRAHSPCESLPIRAQAAAGGPVKHHAVDVFFDFKGRPTYQ
jgi:hypothetical protein